MQGRTRKQTMGGELIRDRVLDSSLGDRPAGVRSFTSGHGERVTMSVYELGQGRRSHVSHRSTRQVLAEDDYDAHRFDAGIRVLPSGVGVDISYSTLRTRDGAATRTNSPIGS